jgi:hypothetical protein
VLLVLLGFSGLIFHTSEPPVIHSDPAAGARLNARLTEAEEKATATSPQVLRVEQNELNSLVASYVKIDPKGGSESSSPVRDLRLILKGDRIRMYMAYDFHGKEVTFELESKLHTSNGLLQFEPLSGKLGALPIPRSALQSSMQKMMDSPEGRQAMRLPSNLSDLRVEEGKMVATFR